MLMAVLGMAIGAQAQTTYPFTGNGAGDTVTNAGLDSLTYKINTTNNKAASIQIVVTKVSGTVAGTAVLYGSNDLKNYVAIGADSLTLADQTTNTKIWVIPATTGVVYAKYKVVVTGSGTMKATCKAYITALKN